MGMTSSPVILGHETIYHKVSYFYLEREKEKIVKFHTNNLS